MPSPRRKKLGCRPLSILAIEAVVALLDQIRRIQSSAARAWSQRFLPPAVREDILEFVTAAAAASAGRHNYDAWTNRLTKFWSILYSQHLRSICLPSELDEKTRSAVMLYLGTSATSSSLSTTTAVLHVSLPGLGSGVGKSVSACPEKASLLSLLSRSTLLTVFSLRRSADDDVMETLGKSCHLLQELNISGSSRVTDAGIALFLAGGSNCASSATLNPVCRSLRLAKMRSTGVRAPGVKMIFKYATNLRGIRCSGYDVLQALAMHVREAMAQGSTRVELSLRYLDMSNCFPILCKFLIHLPNLVEVRVGADAPPSMKKKHQRLMADDTDAERHAATQQSALEHMPGLKRLKTLVLKDYGGMEAVSKLLSTPVGARLQRLDLHFVTDFPGVDLRTIDQLCPNLRDLSVCDSAVNWGWSGWFSMRLPEKARQRLESSHAEQLAEEIRSLEMKATSDHFAKLTHCSGPLDWRCIPLMAAGLRSLHLESADGMTDQAFEGILRRNSDGDKKGALAMLEELLIVGVAGHLSAATVHLVVASCPRLRWLGDLRDWRMTARERRALLADAAADAAADQAASAAAGLRQNWEMRRSEPGRGGGEGIDQAPQTHAACDVRLDTGQIVQGMMRM